MRLPALLLTLLGCKLPELPDVDLRAPALQAAREDAELRWAPIHLDGSGVDAIIGRPAALGLIDAGKRPLPDALEEAVALRQWSTTFNAQAMIGGGPHTGQARGATWRGGKQLDPPEPGSEQLWTLDVEQGTPQKMKVYRGNPKGDATRRLFALGGLEALAVDGDPEVSPSLARDVTTYGATERGVGRTYLGIDRNRGVIAIVVVEHGAPGPRLTELPDALRDAGFEDVLVLDGGTSSTLVHARNGIQHVEARGIHQATAPTRYGIGVRWAQ